MTEQRIDGRRLGTSADAGALCKTKRSPRGVKPVTYRRMREWGGAPHPAINPATKTAEHPDGYPYRDPASGQELYDLDEVERWHKTGRKAPGQWWGDLEHRTPVRLEVARALSNREITHGAETARGHQPVLLRNGVRPENSRAITRAVNDFERAGIAASVEEGGVTRVLLTDKGAQLHARWEREIAAERPGVKAPADEGLVTNGAG